MPRLNVFDGTLVPFDARVVVKLDDEAETHHGLLLPEAERGLFRTGTVLAVGPGRIFGGERCAVQCGEGDTVVFPRNVGQPIQLNGTEARVMTENEITALLK